MSVGKISARAHPQADTDQVEEGEDSLVHQPIAQETPKST